MTANRSIACGVAAIACGVLWGGTAAAQTCASYPNTLTNGAVADATQVMANFNCAALTGNGLFTGNVAMVAGTVLIWNGDAGISRDFGGDLVIGNGTAGDLSGGIGLAKLSIGANV